MYINVWLEAFRIINVKYIEDAMIQFIAHYGCFTFVFIILNLYLLKTINRKLTCWTIFKRKCCISS